MNSDSGAKTVAETVPVICVKRLLGSANNCQHNNTSVTHSSPPDDSTECLKPPLFSTGDLEIDTESPSLTPNFLVLLPFVSRVGRTVTSGRGREPTFTLSVVQGSVYKVFVPPFSLAALNLLCYVPHPRPRAGIQVQTVL